MRRLLIGMCLGVLIGVGLGAALGIRAEPSEDIVALAAEANVDPHELQAASDSVGVTPVVYVRTTPSHTSPPSSTRMWTVWDMLAVCEASGNWASASNPRYKGGLQMDAVFWARYGGLVFARAPHLASREQQIVVAQRGQAVQGWQAWPVCSRRIGLR